MRDLARNAALFLAASALVGGALWLLALGGLAVIEPDDTPQPIHDTPATTTTTEVRP